MIRTIFSWRDSGPGGSVRVARRTATVLLVTLASIGAVAACRTTGPGVTQPSDQNCPAGTTGRTTPGGLEACFVGTGCGPDRVPVRIDRPGGDQMTCGRLAFSCGGNEVSTGIGFFDNSLMCMPFDPCPGQEAVNTAVPQNDVWPLVVRCQ